MATMHSYKIAKDKLKSVQRNPAQKELPATVAQKGEVMTTRDVKELFQL